VRRGREIWIFISKYKPILTEGKQDARQKLLVTRKAVQEGTA
jgi:hypothetical protein